MNTRIEACPGMTYSPRYSYSIHAKPACPEPVGLPTNPIETRLFLARKALGEILTETEEKS
jgi:hypothetical protein